VTVVPIANMIQSSGYEATYLWFGLGQGIVVMVVALLLRAPPQAEVVVPVPPLLQQSRRNHAPADVLKSPPFWLMYAMFVMVGTSGLMATAQLAPVARDFAIDSVPVSIFGLTMPALSFALSFGLVLNGLSRPVFGWLSDQIGREHTMFIAFLLEGIRHLRAVLVREQSNIVRAVVGTGLLRLGRDLCALPGNLYRHLWPQVRDCKLWHALYGQGSGRSLGPVSQRADRGNRKLDGRIRGGIDAQYRRGYIGLGRIEAAADTSDGERKFSAAKSEHQMTLGAAKRGQLSISRPPLGLSLGSLRDQLFDENVAE
jgi:hypothetical protein